MSSRNEAPLESRRNAEEVASAAQMAHTRQTSPEFPSRIEALEEKLFASEGHLSHARSSNEKLMESMEQMRDQVTQLRDEVDKLTQPPSNYGIFLQFNADGSADVSIAGKKMRVLLHPGIEATSVHRGDEVVINDAFNVIEVRPLASLGDVVSIKDVLGAERIVVVNRGGEEQIVDIADKVRSAKLRVGDSVIIDSRSSLVLERLETPDTKSLILEEVPDISYADIGGLDAQIEAITDAVELPYIHRVLFAEYELPAPKGILLYGPPGCGKTLIAKAVANSLAKKVTELSQQQDVRSYFINIKGPELLNKYVGETERQIRVIFQRAREKAEEGVPVIVFFDEMDSLFRTRGSGISSDMESTVVPQLLAEIDGVESLRNVIVIGATNREDLIDPAILRPGRLDVKIKIERPNAEAAAQIFQRYLRHSTPLDAEDLETFGHGDVDTALNTMIEKTVEEMYRIDDENQFLEVTYQGGDKEVMYYKDFASGAMIENIVRRSKKIAVKRELSVGRRGIRLPDLLSSIRQEYRENEDLPNTTNPDDWARISGKKGEKISFIRTLVNRASTDSEGGRAIDHVGTGQYL